MCATNTSGTLFSHSGRIYGYNDFSSNKHRMFITNDFAKKDLACQIAMENYKKQLQREQHYQQQVRDGLIPAPNWNDTQTWNISDRD